jgi:hypothetical protein
MEATQVTEKFEEIEETVSLEIARQVRGGVNSMNSTPATGDDKLLAAGSLDAVDLSSSGLSSSGDATSGSFNGLEILDSGKDGIEFETGPVGVDSKDR